MLINCDKFFVEQLRERGFDLDYKKLVEIYRESRQRPAAKARRVKNQKIAELEEKLLASL